LEQLTIKTTRQKNSLAATQAGTGRLTRNSKIIKTIIHAIREKKGENIISLDLRKVNEAIADFFIVCEATNQPQVRAIAEYVQQEVKIKCSENPYHHEGFQKLSWVLIDYVNVVVHVMLTDTRNFYKMEEMWSDASIAKHEKD
jgi:ribosome-associated protein